jgi:hypothetical protein
VEDVFRKERKSSNKRLNLTLPIPPSVNSIYTMKRQYNAKARDYIRKARGIINEAIEEQHWGLPDRQEWLYVDMVFWMPDRKIRECHLSWIYRYRNDQRGPG